MLYPPYFGLSLAQVRFAPVLESMPMYAQTRYCRYCSCWVTEARPRSNHCFGTDFPTKSRNPSTGRASVQRQVHYYTHCVPYLCYVTNMIRDPRCVFANTKNQQDLFASCIDEPATRPRCERGYNVDPSVHVTHLLTKTISHKLKSNNNNNKANTTT